MGNDYISRDSFRKNIEDILNDIAYRCGNRTIFR